MFGYKIELVWGDEWVAGNLSYHLRSESKKITKWKYDEGLTLCGKYVSTEGLDPADSLTKLGKIKNKCVKFK